MDRYSVSKNKLRKIWENSEANSDKINNNVKKINIDFRSETFLKNINVVSLVENYDISESDQIQIVFTNFPDWAVNFSKPSITFHFDSAYDPSTEVESFFQAFQDGTLKEGDISIIRWNTFHWWTRETDLWKFNVRFNLNARVANSVSEHGFSTVELKTFANVKLYIVNERLYNEIQSG